MPTEIAVLGVFTLIVTLLAIITPLAHDLLTCGGEITMGCICIPRKRHAVNETVTVASPTMIFVRYDDCMMRVC